MADAKDDKTKRDEALKARAAAMAKGGTPLTQVYAETIVELKKTTWPDRDTLYKSVTVVLALIAATAVWVGVIDAILTRLSSKLFGAG